MATEEQEDELIRAFQKDPEFFCEEVLGVRLWSKQVEVLESIRDNPKTSVASGHNVGKTFVAACACLWFIATHPYSRIVSTANSWGQVENILWAEIRRLYNKAIWPIGGRMKKNAIGGLSIDDGWDARGQSVDKTDAAQGLHAENVLIVFDEAQGIDNLALWRAYEAAMGSAGARWLAIGNPLYSYGPFRDTHRKQEWNKIKISCLEHPNVVTGKSVIPAAVTRAYIKQYQDDPLRAPGTNEWRVRIAGEFPELGSDQVVPEEFLRRVAGPKGHTGNILLNSSHIGFDPALFGGDLSVVAVTERGRLERLEPKNGIKPEKAVDWVVGVAREHKIPLHHIHYDSIGGVGSQLTRQFELKGIPADPINNGAPPAGDWKALFSEDPRFRNRRAELHWVCRCLLEVAKVEIDPRFLDVLVAQLCSIKYGVGFDESQLFIEGKKYIKERIGCSPDYADAFVYSFARTGLPQGSPLPVTTEKPKEKVWNPYERSSGRMFRRR